MLGNDGQVLVPETELLLAVATPDVAVIVNYQVTQILRVERVPRDVPRDVRRRMTEK